MANRHEITPSFFPSGSRGLFSAETAAATDNNAATNLIVKISSSVENEYVAEISSPPPSH